MSWDSLLKTYCTKNLNHNGTRNLFAGLSSLDLSHGTSQRVQVIKATDVEDTSVLFYTFSNASVWMLVYLIV